MRMALLCVLVLPCAVGADDVKREWAKFEGVWQRTAYETDGRKVPADNAQRFRLTLRTDGTYAVHVDSQLVVEGTAHLDPAKAPKTIDMTPTTGRSKGQKLLGIYDAERRRVPDLLRPFGKGPAAEVRGRGRHRACPCDLPACEEVIALHPPTGPWVGS